MNIIFLNIGWMKNYKGIDSKDKISGGSKYVKQNSDGDEKCNFLTREDGFCYGYARIKNSIHLQNLIPAATKYDKIENVTVVFFSKDPTRNCAYIVGWYLDATLYRTNQQHTQIISSKTKIKDNIDHEIEGISYICKTKSINAILVPERLRDFIVPYSRSSNVSGYGQSIHWFPKNMTDGGAYIQRVYTYINENTKLFSNLNEKKIHVENETNSDVLPYEMAYETISHAIKIQIEQTAIELAIKYYENRHYNVVSVELDKCGWDLTAIKGDEILHLEVKGTSLPDDRFQLTPNEYDHLKKLIDTYRVIVVNDCLSESPKLTIYKFEYCQKHNRFYGISEYTQSKMVKRIILKELVYACSVVAF